MLLQAESKEIQVTDHPMQWNPVTPVLGPQKPETEVNPQPPCEQDVVIKIRGNTISNFGLDKSSFIPTK